MHDNNDLFIDDAPTQPAFKPKAPGADCANCPLKAQPCVPSSKPDGAIRFAVVGEAPGAEEVSAGTPFVGQSGRLLRKAIEHVGLNPDEGFYSNAVLCRPPGNKIDQYPQAVMACSERIRREIECLPNVPVVLAGATALRAAQRVLGASGDSSIMRAAGHWIDTPDRSFLPILHPAFVLRSPDYISSFLNSLHALNVDRSKDWLATRYYVLKTVEQVVYQCRWNFGDRHIAFDVETSGLNWYATHTSDAATLLCFAFTDGDDAAWVIPGELFSNTTVRSAVQYLLTHTRSIAHNGKFDLNVLSQYGIHADLTSDTMLMHHQLDENPGGHGLKTLASIYLGVPDYEAQLVDKHFRGIDRKNRDYSTIPRDDLYRYVAIDVCATLALHRVFSPMLWDQNLVAPYKIARNGSNMLQRAEQRGFLIDRPYLEKVLYKVTHDIGEAYSAVELDARDFVIPFMAKVQNDPNWKNPDPSWIKDKDHYLRTLDKCINGGTSRRKKINGINIASWQQIQVLFYDVLGLKHGKKLGYKTKPRSTNAEALDSLLEAAPDNQLVRTLKEFRKIDKIRSTYVEPILRLIDRNDRMHISFKLHGTETYRLSCADSQHGIPRPTDQYGQMIRGSYIATPGYKLVMCDYSQGELRVFAALSGEPFLLDTFDREEDPHGNLCLALFGDHPRLNGMTTADYDKATAEWHLSEVEGYTLKDQKALWKRYRTISKNVMFGAGVYLGGASGIAAMIPGGQVTAAQLEPVIKRMKASMPVAALWQQNQFRLARDQGYVTNRFGNRRRFPLITSETLDEIRKASVNAPIQSSLSQLNLISATEFDRRYYARGWYVLHLVHDQIIAEAPEADAEEAALALQSIMIANGAKWFPEVKWRADIEIADRWYQERPEL